MVRGDTVAVLFRILTIASELTAFNSFFDNVMSVNNLMIVLGEAACSMAGCDNLINREDKIEGFILSSMNGDEVTTSVSCNRVTGDWLLIVNTSKRANKVWPIS